MITTNDAKQRLRGYIRKYYKEVRADVLDQRAFRQRLFGYVVSLSHSVAQTKGWQGHNHRQSLRDHLLSFALNEVDKTNRAEQTKKRIRRILTLGIIK